MLYAKVTLIVLRKNFATSDCDEVYLAGELFIIQSHIPCLKKDSAESREKKITNGVNLS
jgi:hypothetical protein